MLADSFVGFSAQVTSKDLITAQSSHLSLDADPKVLCRDFKAEGHDPTDLKYFKRLFKQERQKDWN